MRRLQRGTLYGQLQNVQPEGGNPGAGIVVLEVLDQYGTVHHLHAEAAPICRVLAELGPRKRWFTFHFGEESWSASLVTGISIIEEN